MRELEILEHLSYIIEAIAQEASSEAKCEVGRLHELVEKASTLDPEVKREAVARLRQAQEAIKDHPFSPRHVAAPLIGLNRFLWKRALSKSDTAAEQ